MKRYLEYDGVEGVTNPYLLLEDRFGVMRRFRFVRAVQIWGGSFGFALHELVRLERVKLAQRLDPDGREWQLLPRNMVL